MVANPDRRREIADAALGTLGELGRRGLTHRAVDRAARLPQGTTSNYFATRAALLVGVAQRVFDRLQPEPERLAVLAELRGVAAVQAYVEYVLERLLGAPDLALALVELRLEAGHNALVAAELTPFLRAGFAADVAFHEELGLPGGAELVLALHHLVNGLVLDALTVPLDPDRDPRSLARGLVALLVPADQA